MEIAKLIERQENEEKNVLILKASRPFAVQCAVAQLHIKLFRLCLTDCSIRSCLDASMAVFDSCFVLKSHGKATKEV